MPDVDVARTRAQHSAPLCITSVWKDDALEVHEPGESITPWDGAVTHKRLAPPGGVLADAQSGEDVGTGGAKVTSWRPSSSRISRAVSLDMVVVVVL